MKPVSESNFGLLIAYLVPGFTALHGLGYLSEEVKIWMSGPIAVGPTVGGFLYLTLASVTAGLTASTIRWAVIDTLHHRTGIPKPNWNFRRLQDRISAFDAIQENHYRYYQFYSNMLVSLAIVLVAQRIAEPRWGIETLDVSLVVLWCVFFAGSRDTLRKYYARTSQLLGAKKRR